MRKLLYLLIFSLTLFSCRQQDKGDATSYVDESGFNYQKLPDKTTINAEALALIEEWEEFQKFNESIDVLYKAKNNEDLILAIDDLIEKEKLLAEGNYPEMFNTLQVKSRQRVLKTYLYKVKSHVLENQETTQPTVEMLTAYNALRKQLNIIVNSQLDKELILDED
ncbi:hypothetical protein GTQ34_11650 [Muricauda sp. JGD-17]|uniref:Lipoprotein n=1 Tax=Flagellimonas ochracea TaxID=2696472 RepID=A0A964WY59_9FLAO|nr:hypothetical protein [Allomuricauda ochracea]NAY92572.1 hypothetical protein [Allomuricauda ochracea]